MRFVGGACGGTAGLLPHALFSHTLLQLPRACWQVPDASTIRVDRDDRSGPAGKLRGVHRDFLLLLLYYPYKDG